MTEGENDRQPSTDSLLRPADGCTDSDAAIRQALSEALANPTEGKALSQFWQEVDRQS
jgi:hypothetical protein